MFSLQGNGVSPTNKETSETRPEDSEDLQNLVHVQITQAPPLQAQPVIPPQEQKPYINCFSDGEFEFVSIAELNKCQ